MRTAVIYKSKTGNARKYAELIAEELRADLYSSTQVSVELLFEYDTIVFGGGLYTRGVYGLRKLINNSHMLDGKNLIVFATGAIHPSKQSMDYILHMNFTEKQLEKIKFFYLHSQVNHKKLSFGDKMVLKFMKFKLKNSKSLNVRQSALLEAYESTVNHHRDENVKPLVDYVSSL